jgi:hypothetical protein
VRALEVLRSHVLQQGNNVMHFDFAAHRLEYIASYQPGEGFAVSNDPHR